MPLDFLSIMAAGRQQQDPANTQPAETMASPDPSPAARDYGRVIGYHNALPTPETLAAQFDHPPSYEEARRPRRPQSAPTRPLVPHGQEKLPAYSCTVAFEGTLGMKLESSNPFEPFTQAHWAEVYVVIRGTLLNIHQVKTASFLAKVKNPDRPANSAGRLLKSYTLQHAEAGVATDHEKFELVPRSQFTELLSDATIKQLKETDPQLFYPVRQYVMRLRLETGQFLFRTQTGTELVDWLLHICAAIDIAPPLDDRTEPRYHTLPRRRRRAAAAGRTVTVTEPSLVEEQERLFRQHYPHLSSSPEEQASDKEASNGGNLATAAQADGDADADGDELDLNVVRNGPETPAFELPNPFSSAMQAVASIFDPRIQDSSEGPSPTAPGSANGPALARTTSHTSACAADADTSNFDANGKWQPPHHYGPTQEARYRRRCLPSLCYTSKRSSDVVFYGGRRYEIDWSRRGLVYYPAPPPKYNDIIRNSQLSASTVDSLPALTPDHASDACSNGSRPVSITDQSAASALAFALTPVHTNASSASSASASASATKTDTQITITTTSPIPSPALTPPHHKGPQQAPKQTWRTRLRSFTTARPPPAQGPFPSATSPVLVSVSVSVPNNQLPPSHHPAPPTPTPKPKPKPNPARTAFPTTRLTREHETLVRLSAVGIGVHPALRSSTTTTGGGGSEPASPASLGAGHGHDDAAVAAYDEQRDEDEEEEEGFVEMAGAEGAGKSDALEEEDDERVLGLGSGNERGVAALVGF